MSGKSKKSKSLKGRFWIVTCVKIQDKYLNKSDVQVLVYSRKAARDRARAINNGKFNLPIDGVFHAIKCERARVIKTVIC
jgi:hypothetical protein